jgi:cytochrome oxidase Cu insertion factor (SCO1/SenC/PrrC family)/thiol-disulfide isomerase/thioredoxin
VRRALLTIVALALVALCTVPSLTGAARADGDPGSDVLLDQNLFYGPDAGVSIAQSLELGRLLNGTSAAGAPVRVAIISHAFDLGAITPLWRKPRQYAAYLGFELSGAYRGRLLVVMPNGFGLYWFGHALGPAEAALRGVRPATSGSAAALIAASRAAVARLERSAGVSAAALARATARAAQTSESSAAGGTGAGAGAGTGTVAPPAVGRSGAGQTISGWWVALLLIVAVTSVFWGPFAWRRRGRLRGVRIMPVLLLGRRRFGVPWAAFVPPVVVLAVLALVIHDLGAPTTIGTALASNPNLDPGTGLGLRPAPDFTLVDETGRPVSLRQYRGKVVILSFVDAECQTICPLTTAAMLAAKRALGAAGAHVALLGVNANWRSIQVDDVLNYTELHGLTGSWHFLTGTLDQLNRVWSAYHLNEYRLIEKQDRAATNTIDHVAATFVIDPEGRLRKLYQTATAYSAIPQFGELLAREASSLLPGHPRVASSLSYARIRGLPPTAGVTLARAGGGSVTLGPGVARLALFFASWDRQTTPLAADLEELNAYQALAVKDHLPRVTGVDEASVEPGPQALSGLLAGLPERLRYPVAIDATGRLADGYDVQGEPWFVLMDAAGRILWYHEVYTGGWPSLHALVSAVRGALAHPAGSVTPAGIERELAGSPPPLAALHAQASRVLPGGQRALDARIRSLRGYPVVLNIWGSWCQPCQDEAGVFTRASAFFGRRVAFLGADSNETSPSDGQQFLNAHRVSYPSYETTPESIQQLLPAGLEGTPTTVFISPHGTIASIHIGPYLTQGSLDQDIQAYLGIG